MIKHIAYSLSKAFTANVYRENVNKPELPFFDIRLIDSYVAGEIGNTYMLYEKYEIRYFPKMKEDEISCNEMLKATALKMMVVLEIMEYKDEKVRASDMKYRIEDNVLQFFLICRKRITRDDNHPLIENLETKIERK